VVEEVSLLLLGIAALVGSGGVFVLIPSFVQSELVLVISAAAILTTTNRDDPLIKQDS
jgi:hypothetical protein